LKKAYQFVLILFFIVLLTVPLYWVTKGDPAEESVVEAREMVALKPASSPNLQRALDLISEGKYREGLSTLIKLYTSSSFVSKFETATSDQFPLRLSIIQFSKAIERGIIKLTYSFTPDKIIPADMSRDIYYDSEHNQLIYQPTLFNEETRHLIDERIMNYKELIEAYPDINFYLYYHEILENSEFHPLNPFFSEVDSGTSLKYFMENKPEGLQIKKFMLDDMDDHIKYYYRTDHHWNVFGVLRAYDEIYKMLSMGYQDILPELEYANIVTFPDVEFLGSLARETLYPINGDQFMVEVVNLPPFEMVKSGQVVKEHPRYSYFEGDYSTIPYTNHFNQFYGKVTDLIEYTFNNGSDRNLLIIGSSFRNALDPLLGAHYHKTFCIDLRYYSDFSLSEFLREYNVDDILIIGDDEVAFEDVEYWKINP